MMFDPSYDAVLKTLDNIDPVAYMRTRNYTDGAVTRLSPYISRGIISTRQVLDHVLSKGHEPKKIEKFIQELAWRDYWQEVWKAKGELIDTDLRSPQQDVVNDGMPEAIVNAQTGIHAIDKGIKELYETGYMHNHIRMYVAALACNFGKCHWKVPAQWMYYHLLDADRASNTLSWQWVAGTNSSKKYIANQDNINKYCHTDQKDTFLDQPYETLANADISEPLRKTVTPQLKTSLPNTELPELNATLPVLIYNFYNLDPAWHRDGEFNRILLLEPDLFDRYPVSDHTIRFVVKAAQNIPGIKFFTGTMDALNEAMGGQKIIYKEHPLNTKYPCSGEPAASMFGITGYYPSFFAFWKKCAKVLYG
jgi:deoxyribodipyrimidine photo-lyase